MPNASRRQQGELGACDLAMDVDTILSQLSDFEQRVGRMLMAGHTITSITRELKVGRQCVEDAVAAIRSRLVEEGLGGAVRMISQEQLEEPTPQMILRVLNELEPRMKQLSEVLTRKYLLHSGSPRQINSEPEVLS